MTKIDRRRKAQKTVPSIVAAVAAAAVISGCASIGPDKLVNTHQGYNDAVQLAESREMLLNIVRLRFGDPIQFLAVAQINAQFSVSAGANASATGIGAAGGATGTVGGNVGYSDSPTLTFTPRGDDQFGRDILYPVHLYDAVTYSNRGGVYDGPLFELITSGINEAPDIPGPNGELYRERIAAISKLIHTNLAWIAKGKRYVPKSSIPVEQSNITAFDHVWATNNGYLWVDAEPMIGPAGRGKALMAFEYHTPLMVIRDPENQEAQDLLRTLGLTPGHREYEVRAVNDEVAIGRGPTFMFVGFRSLKEIMGIASEYVEIPSDLEARGIVPPPRFQQTGLQQLSFKVRSSKDEPQDTPYKVSLHDHWFWIDMADHKSKALLEAIYSLFYSQLGATKPGDPILTLPLAPGLSPEPSKHRLN